MQFIATKTAFNTYPLLVFSASTVGGAWKCFECDWPLLSMLTFAKMGAFLVASARRCDVLKLPVIGAFDVPSKATLTDRSCRNNQLVRHLYFSYDSIVHIHRREYANLSSSQTPQEEPTRL